MSQSKINDCYAIEDTDKALACLKQVVQEKGECRPRLVLFTQINCRPCKQERTRYAKDIAEGIIEEINIDFPVGAAIAQKNAIDFIPSLVVLDCHDTIIEPGV